MTLRHWRNGWSKDNMDVAQAKMIDMMLKWWRWWLRNKDKKSCQQKVWTFQGTLRTPPMIKLKTDMEGWNWYGRRMYIMDRFSVAAPTSLAVLTVVMMMMMIDDDDDDWWWLMMMMKTMMYNFGYGFSTAPPFNGCPHCDQDGKNSVILLIWMKTSLLVIPYDQYTLVDSDLLPYINWLVWCFSMSVQVVCS